MDMFSVTTKRIETMGNYVRVTFLQKIYFLFSHTNKLIFISHDKTKERRKKK